MVRKVVILMKLAFISDIHGNAAALEAVLKDIKEKKVNNYLYLEIYVIEELILNVP